MLAYVAIFSWTKIVGLGFAIAVVILVAVQDTGDSALLFWLKIIQLTLAAVVAGSSGPVLKRTCPSGWPHTRPNNPLQPIAAKTRLRLNGNVGLKRRQQDARHCSCPWHAEIPAGKNFGGAPALTRTGSCNKQRRWLHRLRCIRGSFRPWAYPVFRVVAGSRFASKALASPTHRALASSCSKMRFA